MKLGLYEEIEFNKIVSDILKNETFLNIENEYHHGCNRLMHSLNVAKTSYNWARKLRLPEYKDITRAALLHDFFTKEELHKRNQLIHPFIANANSKKYFSLNARQENMILSHMWPLSVVLPTNIGSWLISCADKYCAVYECTKFKLAFDSGAISFFILYFLTVKK